MVVPPCLALQTFAIAFFYLGSGILTFFLPQNLDDPRVVD
jgi:hypothetical protein